MRPKRLTPEEDPAITALEQKLQGRLRWEAGDGHVRALHIAKVGIGEFPREILSLRWLRVLNIYGNRLHTLPDEIGSLSELTELDCSGNHLEVLPDSIGNLTSLYRFSCAENQLTIVPHWIGRLNRLEYFKFSNNFISSIPDAIENLIELRYLLCSNNFIALLPEVIGKLGSLTNLDCSYNPLLVLPEWIGKLCSLRELVCSNNQLSALPASIGQLSDLRSLNCSENQLSVLPTCLDKLSELTDLTCYTNRLTALPEEIGKLTRLAKLSCSYNQLSTLPNDIGDLKLLTEIFCNNNQLVALPDTIGELSALTHLYCFDNQLASLPATFHNLSELKHFWCFNNHLVRLPDRFSDLRSLEEFQCNANRLKTLPEYFGSLRQLTTLDLTDNPLPEFFPNLLTGETQDVMRYIADVQRDGIPQYAARLVLVGNGAAGKTQLRNALLKRFDKVELKSTQGVEIEREDLKLPHPDGGKEVTLHLWDFGGQESYEVTHQFFFSPGSVYLLVWHPRRFDAESGIENWLRKLRLRLGDQARVIIVATHKLTDERPVDLDLHWLRQKFPGMVLGVCSVESLSNNDAVNGIPELKTAIAQAAAGLPDMGRKISQRWATLTLELVVLGRSRPRITRAEYDDLARKHDLSPAAADTWLRRMHDLGYVLYYAADDELKHHVVLAPAWITQAIARVLDDEELLKSGGQLKHSRFPEIWAYRGNPDEPRFDNPALYSFFHRMMEQFDICVPEGKGDWSLVGEKVPHAPPPLPAPAADASRLEMVYEFQDEPLGLIPWAIVRLHAYGKRLHWRTGVYLEFEGNGATLEYAPTVPARLKIRVAGKDPDFFLHQICGGIELLARDRWHGLLEAGRIKRWIPCNRPGCDGQFERDRLIERRKMTLKDAECPNCFKRWSVTELLTGFAPPEEPLAEQLRRIEDQLGRVSHQVTSLGGNIEAANAGLQRAINDMRQVVLNVLKSIDSEFKECPRLFTVWPKEAKDRSFLDHVNPKKWIGTEFTLWLWCDHLERLHPVRSYDFTLTDEWAKKVSGYMKLACKTLKMVLPVCGVSEEVFKSHTEMAEKFSDAVLAAAGEHQKDHGVSGNQGLTAAEGDGLRALHALLKQLDPADQWQLRRVRNKATGDYHWVCKEHHPYYDPGVTRLDAGNV